MGVRRQERTGDRIENIAWFTRLSHCWLFCSSSVAAKRFIALFTAFTLLFCLSFMYIESACGCVERDYRSESKLVVKAYLTYDKYRIINYTCYRKFSKYYISRCNCARSREESTRERERKREAIFVVFFSIALLIFFVIYHPLQNFA